MTTFIATVLLLFFSVSQVGSEFPKLLFNILNYFCIEYISVNLNFLPRITTAFSFILHSYLSISILFINIQYNGICYFEIFL